MFKKLYPNYLIKKFGKIYIAYVTWVIITDLLIPHLLKLVK